MQRDALYGAPRVALWTRLNASGTLVNGGVEPTDLRPDLTMKPNGKNAPARPNGQQPAPAKAREEKKPAAELSCDIEADLVLDADETRQFVALLRRPAEVAPRVLARLASRRK